MILITHLCAIPEIFFIDLNIFFTTRKISIQVEYDFQYYKMDMTADVQLLVLSEGKSNILPADLVLPFQPSTTGTLETIDEEILQSWRWYLTTLRSLSHSISPEMQKVSSFFTLLILIINQSPWALCLTGAFDCMQ